MSFLEEVRKQQYWYDNVKNVRLKEDYIVVKKRKYDGHFDKSVIIPSYYYPLNKAKYEVFTAKNTEIVTDENVIRIFDSVKYQIGFCYTNSQDLWDKLHAAGYDAKIYCGWLFTGENEFPIHHCWVVIGNSVLDLSDDYVACVYMNRSNWTGNESKEETRMKLADFLKASLKWKNSERCVPVGVPAPNYLYVGCECASLLGKIMYNQLIQAYPNHDCHRNCDAKGKNATQEYIRRQVGQEKI